MKPTPSDSSQYTTKSTSHVTAEVSRVVLPRREQTETPQSQKVLYPEVVENPHDPEACLKVTLAYEKRHSKKDKPEPEAWDDLDRIHLTSLRQGQKVQIDLDTNQTLSLYKELQNLYAVACAGVTFGTTKKVVVSEGRAAVYQALEELDLSAHDPVEVYEALRKLAPQLVESAAIAELHRTRCEAVKEFEVHFKAEDWTEPEWENFFRTNNWIFGHGLAYRFLSEVQGQATTGGTTKDGTGAQRVDFLMGSLAQVRFTALVDIKKPSTPLLNDRLYRNKVHMVSGELAGGTCQLQGYCRTWDTDGSRQEDNREVLEGDSIYTVQPQGILVIGNSATLDTRAKRTTFELYRRNTTNPDILTFDEVLERAKMLVEFDAATPRD